MANIKEVLRLKYECGLSTRKIAACAKVGRSTISEILTRFEQSDLDWPLLGNYSDTELTQALYREKTASQDKIMMRLRHRTFHTFHELNLSIRELMDSLNQREMKQLGASRKALFDSLDKPALKPLPAQRYLYTEIKRAKVGPDYHIEYRRHYYSVPHQLVGQHVDLEANSRLTQIYHQGNLVSQHPASQKERGLSTHAEHMPSNHQYQKWSPERLLSWGGNVGPATREVVSIQLRSKEHPAQAYRSCLGLLNLTKQYGDVRLEQACKDALMVNKPYLRFIRNLLEHHREGQLSSDPHTTPDIQHSNVRGPNRYH
ncbi:TPA: hypothetical protein NJ192_004831 [Vibrio parahaemolyticus]|nr:hypothetical protein [Vibrio parahaemolyticus]